MIVSPVITEKVEARMLDSSLLVEDAIQRGVSTHLPDGSLVTVFDHRFHFVVLVAEGDVAKKVYAGPFQP